MNINYRHVLYLIFFHLLTFRGLYFNVCDFCLRICICKNLFFCHGDAWLTRHATKQNVTLLAMSQHVFLKCPVKILLWKQMFIHSKTISTPCGGRFVRVIWLQKNRTCTNMLWQVQIRPGKQIQLLIQQRFELFCELCRLQQPKGAPLSRCHVEEGS